MLHQRLVGLARSEPDAEVRSELAHTAGRLDTDAALAVLYELIRRQEDVRDRHVSLRIWWSLEAKIATDADVVLKWLDKPGLWQAPLFTEQIAGRVARRFAADRGDTHAFRRIDPDTNWKAYALHPRSLMPGGKGDYTDWETNYTPGISDRSLTRLARVLEMAPASQRERLLVGANAGLGQGVASAQVPEHLSAVIDKWWADQPHTGALVEVAARLGHRDAINVAKDRARASAPPADERGRTAFLTYCAPCHQTDGSGMARLGAPLRNSTWVLGQEDQLARIVLHGLKGELLMPAMGTLDDQLLADILTYIRRAWGHQAGPVAPETVARIRAASSGRTAPWTRVELSALGVR
jgi:mono/diheme cytochrome c family protein